jgi:hypothetical protein
VERDRRGKALVRWWSWWCRLGWETDRGGDCDGGGVGGRTVHDEIRAKIDRLAAGFTSLQARVHDLPSMSLRPACQPGLASTPKLTGGHDVARSPDQVVGFALRPAWREVS